MMITSLCIALLLLGGILILRRRRPNLPLPPGPPGLPVIGNIFDFPSNLGPGFRDLAARYGGELVYLRALGRQIIVVGSYQAAYDLLEKRSTHSDRPDSVMQRLASLDVYGTPTMRYGQKWRQHRRIFHQSLHRGVVNSQYPTKLRQVVHNMLMNLVENPGEFSNHVEHAFAASVLSVGYGIQISRDDDQYVHVLRATLHLAESVTIPGKYLVEALPFLEYLPSWFPGTQFKADAYALREEFQNTMHQLYNEGKRRILQEHGLGDLRASMLGTTLQRIATFDTETAAEEEETCAGVAVSTYIAGSDTSIASTRAFFLAMALYPHVQKKAQAELESVVGLNRLPDLSDRVNLPYVDALVKELARWHVVAPIGLPHTARSDDEYNGYHIPKGSVIIPSLWAFSRDPEAYPDPETFNPDRFLKDGKVNPDVRDPYTFVFGFGRRICPGRYLADASTFLTCASVLHTFNITPPLDQDGNPRKLEPRMTTQFIISKPEEFDCLVKPRSVEAVELIRSSVSA